jgi:hypothetical protein
VGYLIAFTKRKAAILMKKLIVTFSVIIFLLFGINTITTLAQQKSFSQGFYAMKDLNLYEGSSHTVKNISQIGEGLLIVLDSHGIIQQVIRVHPTTEYTLVPILPGYEFIIYRDLQLVFK